MVTSKPWGVSERVFIDERTQVERINVFAGGYSSIHLHKHKTNIFVVNCGKLLVKFYDELLTHTHTVTLVAPARREVYPGERHQFYAENIVVATEIYICMDGTLDPNDIERFSDNGCVYDSAYDPLLSQYNYCALCSKQLTDNATLVHVAGAMRQVCQSCKTKLCAT